MTSGIVEVRTRLRCLEPAIEKNSIIFLQMNDLRFDLDLVRK